MRDLRRYPLTLALLLFAVVWATANALTLSLSFDGAMNVQVSQNLVRHHRYATSYDDQRLFDHRIQTGAPYLLPVALLYGLAGPSMAAANLVNAAYLVLLLVLLARLVHRLTGQDGAAAVPLLLILLTPATTQFGFGGLGEIPAMAWLVAAITGLQRAHDTGSRRAMTAAGLCFGLAYLTKTVALIALPAFAAVFVYDRLTRRRFSLTHGLLFLISLIGPIVGFELFKAVQLGGDGYLAWWQYELPAIGVQAVGAGSEAGPSPLHKLAAHWNILTRHYDYDRFLLGLGLALTLIAYPCLRLRRGWRSLTPAEIMIPLMAAGYLVWWLGVTPTSKIFMRRIMNGMALYHVTLGLAGAAFLAEARRLRAGRPRWAALALIAALATVGTALPMAARNIPRLAIPLRDAPGKTAAYDCARALTHLATPGTRCFGYLWWQAPVLAFAAQVPVDNLSGTDQAAFDPPALLLVDQTFAAIQPGVLSDLLSCWSHTGVYAHAGNSLYRLYHRRPPDFPDAARDAVTVPALDLQQDETLIRGAHAYEAALRGRWLTQGSAFLLHRSHQAALLVEFWSPPPADFSRQPAILTLTAEGHPLLEHTLTHAGIQTLTLPLPDTLSPEGPIVVAATFNTRLSPKTRDGRELTVVLHRLALTN